LFNFSTAEFTAKYFRVLEYLRKLVILSVIDLFIMFPSSLSITESRNKGKTYGKIYSSDLSALDTASSIGYQNPEIPDDVIDEILKMECEGTSVDGARKLHDLIRDKFREIDINP
jgi:hypothetical protein